MNSFQEILWDEKALKLLLKNSIDYLCFNTKVDTNQK